MSTRHLDHLLQPRSIAIIGASARPSSVGALALHNVLAGEFDGPIWLLNPHYQQLMGMPVYADIAALPGAPDLAIVCTPPASVPAIVAALGQRGTRAVLVLGAAPASPAQCAAVLEAARPYQLRVLGPASLGLVLPALGLNASYALAGAAPGHVALLSTSNSLASAVLDWSAPRGIGFSCCAALGQASDIDLADLLDYLGGDSSTRAILLCMEQFGAARKLIAAGRRAAQAKPLLALVPGAARAPLLRAALARAGMVPVSSLEQLFEAAETLALVPPPRGGGVVIVGNGRAPGLLAADALAEHAGAHGAHLASLAPATLARLEQQLGLVSEAAAPLDLGGGADAARYCAALEIVEADPACATLLVLHAPSAMASSSALAHALAQLSEHAHCSMLSAWLGDGAQVQAARQICRTAGLAAYPSGEAALAALGHLLSHGRSIAALRSASVPAPPVPAGRRAAAVALVRQALAEQRSVLGADELARLLGSYGLAVLAHSAEAMAPAAPTWRVAGQCDPVFGPALSVGPVAGAAADRAWELAPLDAALAGALLEQGLGQAACAQLAPAQRASLLACLLGLAALMEELAEVAAISVEALVLGAADAPVLAARVQLACPA